MIVLHRSRIFFLFLCNNKLENSVNLLGHIHDFFITSTCEYSKYTKLIHFNLKSIKKYLHLSSEELNLGLLD
jgi:hypothetical protein